MNPGLILGYFKSISLCNSYVIVTNLSDQVIFSARRPTDNISVLCVLKKGHHKVKGLLMDWSYTKALTQTHRRHKLAPKYTRTVILKVQTQWTEEALRTKLLQ